MVVYRLVASSPQLGDPSLTFFISHAGIASVLGERSHVSTLIDKLLLRLAHADHSSSLLSTTDKAVFGLLSLQYLSGGLGDYRLGFAAPAAAFATGVLPMLGALFVE
jgi:hypothetical protein